MRIKRLTPLLLCGTMLFAQEAMAGSSPVAKPKNDDSNRAVMEDTLRYEEPAPNGTTTEVQRKYDDGTPFLGMEYKPGQSLISPETGIFGGKHIGFVDDVGTEVPEKAYKPETDSVDWNMLEEINPEIYAWIRIPQTNISYPIMQHSSIPEYTENYEEQLYYKWHDYLNNEKDAGSIFTQYPSNIDFQDQINFVYGNNVIDGSMFQNLHMFMQDVDVDDLHLNDEKKNSLLSRKVNDDGIRELTEDDLTVNIYTKGKKYTYRIYSAYYWNNEHLQFYLDNSKLWLKLQTKEERDAYIETSKNPETMQRLLYDTDDVKDDSRILTMSTSISNNDASRLLVQAVLINEEDLQGEQPEGIS